MPEIRATGRSRQPLGFPTLTVMLAVSVVLAVTWLATELAGSVVPNL